MHTRIIIKDVEIVGYGPKTYYKALRCSVAARIWDLAMLHLYHYYYNAQNPSLAPDHVPLLMTDTDNLMFGVNRDNIFDKYKKLPLFDFSKLIKTKALFSSKAQIVDFFRIRIKPPISGKLQKICYKPIAVC